MSLNNNYNHYLNSRKTYCFQKASNLCQENLDELMVHTVGKIIYSYDKICLESLNKEEHILLQFWTDFIPEDGMYIHLYGVIKNFVYKDDKKKRERKTIVNIHIWNDLGCEKMAKTLEQILYKIND